MARASRILFVVVTALAASCAQLQGLDSYEKVDCLDDCLDAAAPEEAATIEPVPDATLPDDAAPTCPDCDGATPICDPVSLKCVECLPGERECAPGQFCDPDPALGYRCNQGCAVVEDCIAAMDAGADAGALASLACCNNRCADMRSSATHCGACGNACAFGSSCCDGACTDTVSNKDSCGGCGLACSSTHVASPTCQLSSCAAGICDVGYADCNNDKLSDGCESDVYSNPNKCGACNKVCSKNHVPSPSCGNGICSGACEAGWVDCNNDKLNDGCEVRPATDPDHCGSCSNVCSSANVQTRTCSASTCNGTCKAGYADCNGDKLSDGCETNLNDDPLRCGACTTPCSTSHIKADCKGGQCVGPCMPGWADCDGNLRTNGCESLKGKDTYNCATCGDACPAGKRNCVEGNCEPGYGQSHLPTTTFLDACALGGTAVLRNVDNAATAATALPFSFPFYGATQTEYWFSSNGVLGFGADATPTPSFGCPLPTDTVKSGLIFALAMDLETRGAGVCATTVGTAPNRKLVVTWKDALRRGAPLDHLTFSVVLEETTQRIHLEYGALSYDGADAVVGVQPPPDNPTRNDRPTVYACKPGLAGPLVKAGDGITFTP